MSSIAEEFSERNCSIPTHIGMKKDDKNMNCRCEMYSTPLTRLRDNPSQQPYFPPKSTWRCLETYATCRISCIKSPSVSWDKMNRFFFTLSPFFFCNKTSPSWVLFAGSQKKQTTESFLSDALHYLYISCIACVKECHACVYLELSVLQKCICNS